MRSFTINRKGKNVHKVSKHYDTFEIIPFLFCFSSAGPTQFKAF